MADARKAQLGIIFVTIFVYLVGFGIIIPIMPLLARDFGASALQVGLLMSVFSAMQFLFAPMWGRLSDRYGRRPILLFCLLGEGLCYFAFAYSHTLLGLFVARALAGFFGASISTASAYISDITPRHERSKGMALVGVAFGLGFLVGPALGGALTLLAGKFSTDHAFVSTFSFLFVSGLCFVNFIFALKFLKESLTPDHVDQAQSRRVRKFLHYLVRPVVGPLLGAYFLSTFAMATMESTLILLVGDKFGWGIREVSFGFAYIGVISVLAQGFLVRRLLPVVGEKKLLMVGLSALSIALATIAIAPSIGWLACSMTLLAFGTSFTNPSALGSLSLLSDSSEQGAILGTAQGSSALARILGPAIGGYFYQTFTHGSPFVLGGLMGFIGVLLVASQYAKLPQSAKSDIAHV